MHRRAAISAAFIAICLPAAAPAEDSVGLVWRGCAVSKIAFMENCAAAYERETGVKVRLSGGGATLGIEAAASGGADLGGTCRACLKRLNEDQLDVKLAIVAWDALVVVVHRDNPVVNITRDQLRDVLQQKVTDWSELGGGDGRIVVVARRGKNSGVGYSTRLLILGNPDLDYGGTVVRLSSSGPVEELVERQPRAIAITGVSSALKRRVKTLSIDGHAPTAENIASGVYPYFRPLYIAYKPGRNAVAERFVQWLLSERGQGVVAECDVVTLAQGAGLVAKYQHYEDREQIVNFPALQKLAAGE